MKEAPVVLDNSNIVESYPGITLPLTYSFIQIAYRGVFGGAVAAHLKNGKILSKYENVFDNMIAIHNGRIYYAINNWYALIDFIPFSKKIIPIWQDMMGVKNTEVYMGRLHRFTLPQKMRLYWNVLKTALGVPRSMKRLEGDFAGAQKYFDDTYTENLTVPELIGLFREIERRVLDKWHITVANDMYCFVWTGILKARLAKKGIDATEVTKYISGITGLESLKPVKALLELAKKHGDDPNLLGLPAVREYIRIYGDRCPQELKLECMTYRECPALLEEQVRAYAKDKNKLDGMIASLEARRETKAGFVGKRARLGIKNREISRLNRARIYGMVRRIFVDIGKKVFGGDWFDIFYLTADEIFRGEFDIGLVEKRKAQYAEYEKMPYRARLVFSGGVQIEEAAPAARPGALRGLGASRGSFEGEAVVLDEPSGDVEVEGKIIVTKTTDPGWVFLLCRAGGIVAEKGSLLSHTSIISRELKIPAVVAVENATSAIKTGDMIRICGDDGRVEIVGAD